MFHRIKALIIKELLAVWRDKKSRLALIAPPLFQLIILSHAATLEVRNISIGYFNQDSGWYSHELIERLKGSSYFQNVYPQTSFNEAKKNLDAQKIIATLQITSDFSRNIAAQKPGVVQLILDGRKTNASQIVQGYIAQIIADFNDNIVHNLAQGMTIKPTKIEQKVNNKLLANTQEPPPNPVSIEPVTRSWFNENLDYINYNVPCLIGILSMIMGLTVTSLAVAREREMGTFDQLLVSPLQPWQILLGKMIPALIIAVGESSFIMFISMILFRIPFNGNFFLLYISMFFFILSILGVGLFISALSKTQQQASLGTFVFMTPTMLLSGYATPVENMPGWLQPISECLPITHFFVIIKGIFSKDASLIQVLGHIWPMILISIFTLTLAGWMFGRRVE